MRKKIESRPIESNQKQEAVSRTSNFYSRVSEGLKSAKDRMLESKKSLLLAMAALFALSTEAAAGVEIVVDGEVVNQVPEKKEQQKSPEKEVFEDDETLLKIIDLHGSVMKDKKIPEADRKILEKGITLKIIYVPVSEALAGNMSVYLSSEYFKAANYSPILIDGKILKVEIVSEKGSADTNIKFPENSTGYERVVIESNEDKRIISGSIYENYTQEIAKMSGYSIQASQKVVEKYSQKITEVSPDMIRGIERVRDLFPKLVVVDTIRIVNSDKTNAFYSYADSLTMSISFTEAFGAKTMSSDVTEAVAMHETFHHIDFMKEINKKLSINESSVSLNNLFNEAHKSGFYKGSLKFFLLLNERSLLSSIGIRFGGHAWDDVNELFASVMTTMLHPRFSEVIENIDADEMQALYYASDSIAKSMSDPFFSDQKGYQLLLINKDLLKSKFKERFGDSKKDLLKLKYYDITPSEILELRKNVILRLSKKLKCDKDSLKSTFDDLDNKDLSETNVYMILDKLMKVEFDGSVTLNDFISEKIISYLIDEVLDKKSLNNNTYILVTKDKNGNILIENRKIDPEYRVSGFGLYEDEKTIKKWDKKIHKLSKRFALEYEDLKMDMIKIMKNLNPKDQENFIKFLEKVDIAPNITWNELMGTGLFEKIIKFSQDYKESKFAPQIFKGEDGQIQIVSY